MKTQNMCLKLSVRSKSIHDSARRVILTENYPSTVYLTGNYIGTCCDALHPPANLTPDQRMMDQAPYPDSDMDSEEEAFNLEDVSSDVEFDAAGLDDAERFGFFHILTCHI